MKLMKFTFAAAIALAFSSAYAFHSGGVGECVGCHSMHSPKAGGSYLLVGQDQSSACLTCHMNVDDTGPNGYHIATIDAKLTTGTPLQRTPGGDFSWLKKDFPGTNDESSQHRGHNIVAKDFGFAADTERPVAPGGGSFPAAQLACNSCHDPHGQFRRLTTGAIVKTGQPIWASGSYYDGSDVLKNEPKTSGEAVGVYRLLAGAGYAKDGITFLGVPAAKAPSTYNRTEAATQTRVAYGVATTNGHVAWGAWCATCHPGMHSSGNYVHPVDQDLGSTIKDNYDQYVKSGNLTGGNGTAFSSLAPFAEKTADYAALAVHAVRDNSVLTGPASTDQVTCLSCHRAHASGFEYGLRFDVEYEFMTKGGAYVGSDNPEITGTRAGVQHRGRTIADWTASYYDRPATQFATYQRLLCNKCHAKD